MNEHELLSVIKELAYFGSLIVAVVWSYANTNKKIEMNMSELNKIKEQFNIIIAKEKELIEHEMSSQFHEIEIIKKDLKTIYDKLNKFDKTSSYFVSKDYIIDNFITKKDLERVERLYVSLKSDFNEKLSEIKNELKRHIDEENQTFKKVFELLNKINSKI